MRRSISIPPFVNKLKDGAKKVGDMLRESEILGANRFKYFSV